MKIEFLLIAVIALIIGLDYFLKKKHKDTSKEISKFGDSDSKSIKKYFKLKWILVSAGVIAMSSFFLYQLKYAPEIYQLSEVVFNKNLAYLKSDMSLLNGKISDSAYKGLFNEGKRVGYHNIQYKYFDKDTLLNEAEGEFINNYYNGLWSFYHNNGQLAAKGRYNKSKGIELGNTGIPNKNRDGLWRFWYENGQLRNEVNYSNGEAQGLVKSWYENGQLRIEVNFSNGEEQGLYKNWYENGQLRNEVNYSNGEEQGLHKSWYENGKQKGESNYSNGEVQGPYKNWHENGNLWVKGEWRNGAINGFYQSWYKNGQIESEGYFNNGDRQGLWRFWDRNGTRRPNQYY